MNMYYLSTIWLSSKWGCYICWSYYYEHFWNDNFRWL